MPSPFDAIAADMQAAMDSTFGEGIRLRPMAGDGNYSAAADPDRPVRDTRAIVSRAPKVGQSNFRGTTTNGAALAVAPSEVWLDRAAWAALGYTPRRGDRIEFTEDSDPPPQAAIAAVQAGEHGDLRLILVSEGTAE